MIAAHPHACSETGVPKGAPHPWKGQDGKQSIEWDGISVEIEQTITFSFIFYLALVYPPLSGS